MKTNIEILDIVQWLTGGMGMTIVMITHEPEIASCARRSIHFKGGSVGDDRENSSLTIILEERQNR